MPSVIRYCARFALRVEWLLRVYALRSRLVPLGEGRAALLLLGLLWFVLLQIAKLDRT